MSPLIWMLPIVFCGFVALWFLATRQLRRMSRMTKEVDIDPGVPLRTSRLGSANINGVFANNCVRITEHADGWLVSMWPLFGAGKIWLPRNAMRIHDMGSRGVVRNYHREVRCGNHRLMLYGRLADFMEAES